MVAWFQGQLSPEILGNISNAKHWIQVCSDVQSSTNASRTMIKSELRQGLATRAKSHRKTKVKKTRLSERRNTIGAEALEAISPTKLTRLLLYCME
ncbi:hypothetical protein V6N13_032504 [Hibiscus sabdariffa]|uniref:Uncharacterized protein n=2 Tax=Hibiscus sabdariffa TaxID=183260 RepID=A0ABR2C1I7_9ROSI